MELLQEHHFKKFFWAEIHQIMMLVNVFHYGQISSADNALRIILTPETLRNLY